jgi:hypothetical protein
MRVGIPCFAKKVLGNACLMSSLLAIVACGGMNSKRVLMSMSVSPAAADAQNFANGQVMFSATGTFSQPPSPAAVTFMAPYSGSWSVSDANVASIDQNGVARCVQGQTGIVTVSAIASSNSATGPGQMSTAVTAKATLSCP